MRDESDFTIRYATSADAAILGWHRARMWQDMGEVPNELFEPLRARAEAYLKRAVEAGEYVGWLAAPVSARETIIGGGGIHLRGAMPFPTVSEGTARIAEGQLGTIVNVFTEPEWRRRGVAALLMQRMMDWSREQRLDRLTLHASDAGRALYEKLGFVASNEMRFPLSPRRLHDDAEAATETFTTN